MNPDIAVFKNIVFMLIILYIVKSQVTTTLTSNLYDLERCYMEEGINDKSGGSPPERTIQTQSGTNLTEDNCKTNCLNNRLCASVTYLVSGNVKFCVYYTAAEEMLTDNPGTIHFRRNCPTAPHQPEIVSVDEITATSVTVTWTIADPRPGRTTYEITLTADQPATDVVVIVEGFNNRSVVVTGLQEYWDYQVQVKASTSVGSKTSTSTSTRTKPAAPGTVSHFKIIGAPSGVYTWMQVSWKAPDILQRNSIIKDYSLVHNAEGKSPTTQSLSHESVEDHEYTIVVTVIPEETYTFQVYATNEQDMKGEITTAVKQAPAGVPLNIEDTLQVDVISASKMTDKEPGKLIVLIVPEFFEESGNGRIQATGLTACAKDCNFSRIKTLSDFNTMRNWKEASEKGFTLYRVTSPTWLLELQAQSCSCVREKRDITNLEYTLGSDDCTDASSDEYCNGPLSPDTKLLLVAVSCTNGGCLLSREYGPFTTAPAPESTVTENNCTTQSLVIGVVLGLIIVMLSLYAGYTTLLLRRYRASKDDSEMRKVKKSSHKEQIYVNESFMAGAIETGERPSNSTAVRYSETEYSKLDDNTRDDRKTYDIIQAM